MKRTDEPTRATRRRLVSRAAPLIALALLWPLDALAAGGHGFVLKEHGYYILDFLLLVTILTLALRGPLKSFFQNRRANLEKEIDEARRLQDEARATLEEYKRRLAGVDEEVARITEQARKDAKALELRLIEEGKAQASKLLADAEARVRQERQALRDRLEKQLVVAAVAMAEETVRGKLDASRQQDFLRRYVEDMERLGH